MEPPPRDWLPASAGPRAADLDGTPRTRPGRGTRPRPQRSSSGVRGGGEGERHGGALADRGLHVDAAVVQLHDAIDHGETDARSLGLRRVVEAEDLVEVL